MIKSEIQSINDSIMWSSLIELNNLDLIFKWIDFSFSKSETSDSTEITNDVYQLFGNKLNQTMLDLIPISRNLPNHSKEMILNYLAKYKL